MDRFDYVCDMRNFFRLYYKVLWVLSLAFLPILSFAQVTYSSALNLAMTRASKIGYEVVNYKTSNLNGTNKKLYWFMSVGNSGGACLMSIPETALKVDYSKCVSSYGVSSLSDAYREIPEYFDRDEFQRQQEMEKKKQLAEEKRIADETRQRKLQSDRELPPIIRTLESLSQSKDTVEMLRVLQDLENRNLINGYENSVNAKKLEKFLDIKIFVEERQIEKERLENERLEKERLEKERLEKERLEKERLEKERLEKERLEKERLENYRLETERLEIYRLEKERLEKQEKRKERIGNLYGILILLVCTLPLIFLASYVN